jgi:hypothetical protein
MAGVGVSGDETAPKPIDEQIQGHDARNVALLARVRELGAPLDVARTIDCFFWAPSAAAAELLRDRLVAKGLENVLTSPPPDEDAVWSVQGTLLIRPDVMGSRGMTSQLVELAAACDAEYDGWGTAIHEAAPGEPGGPEGSPTSGWSCRNAKSSVGDAGDRLS